MILMRTILALSFVASALAVPVAQPQDDLLNKALGTVTGLLGGGDITGGLLRRAAIGPSTPATAPILVPPLP